MEDRDMGEAIDRCRGCREYRELSRRGFLAESPLTAAAIVTSPIWLPRIVLAASQQTRDTIVVVFLRGGIDGLTAVVPYGDPNLYSPTLRPDLAVPPPGEPNGAVDLDGFFGLPPALATLLPAYQSGQLAFVHATGSPDPTRSHFDASTFMEYAIPLLQLPLFTGWLGRHLQIMPPMSTGPLRAVALSHLVPKTLAGAPATLPIPDPASFDFPGREVTTEERRAVIEATYASAGEPLSSAAATSLETIDLLATIKFENYTPAKGAVYPESAFGNALKSTAALIKADVGVEAATIDKGGWDTHDQQGPIEGAMAALMDDLGAGLAAFHIDMQEVMDRLTLVVMSEFGRRADENASLGTDHGHGNAMMVMGGHIAGGQVLADWTGGELLHPDNLYEGDSLEVTIDYRDILAEIVQNRLNNSDLATVFPGYTPRFRRITI